MQEVVTPSHEEQPELVIQWHSDLMNVGVGLQPRRDVDSSHFIDMIYGEDESLVKIGHIFRHKLQLERRVDPHSGFTNANAEKILDQQLGRLVLDAVTGSSPVDGWWTWLDRPSCNRLIRLIKKARDAAFGPDA